MLWKSSFSSPVVFALEVILLFTCRLCSISHPSLHLSSLLWKSSFSSPIVFPLEVILQFTCRLCSGRHPSPLVYALVVIPLSTCRLCSRESSFSSPVVFALGVILHLSPLLPGVILHFTCRLCSVSHSSSFIPSLFSSLSLAFSLHDILSFSTFYCRIHFLVRMKHRSFMLTCKHFSMEANFEHKQLSVKT